MKKVDPSIDDAKILKLVEDELLDNGPLKEMYASVMEIAEEIKSNAHKIKGNLFRVDPYQVLMASKILMSKESRVVAQIPSG